MKLYGYWRSTAAYRVRIALHHKKLPFESVPVHLVKDGGQQHQQAYVSINPNHLVPTLVDQDLTLNQSLAIIEYLDERYPQSPLLPGNIITRAKARALALDIACEIHPVNNLRIQQYLSGQLQLSDADKKIWVDHWMSTGFTAIESQLANSAGKFCFGDDLSIADICLVPQVYNANRFAVDMSAFPIISKVVEQCLQLPEFILALPENQPDAQ